MRSVVVGCTSLICMVGGLLAQDVLPATFQRETLQPPKLIIEHEPTVARLYLDGSQIEVPVMEVWRFTCGSDLVGVTQRDLGRVAEQHAAIEATGPVMVVDSSTRAGGINIIYALSGNIPSGADTSFAIAESYIEGLFADPITVRISVSFQNLGGGVLGATGTNTTFTSYANSRNGLQADMDADDTIQGFLPAGSTIPVRYNGSNDSITNESTIFWDFANFKAAVGSVTGTVASMVLNSSFSWDFDPSNGVPGTRWSLVDVIVHETGHALGFSSNADEFLASPNDMYAMDMFRFQRTDGCCDYNPDTEAEFQTAPRLVDFNNPNDAHNTDLIFATYRMSDGNPFQASHFREQSPSIGQMDPSIANGETKWPNLFRQSDMDVFDAIGYDNGPCPDADGDGVCDDNDGCPNDPNKIDPGACGCGVPDVDSDGDGSLDCLDQCPNDPNKIIPGLCGCGVPDTDSDGDFTPDCFDQCPNDPDKVFPGDCGCGVPDTDSDGDGVADCVDQCPGQDDTLDSDGDMTPDCLDACPNDPNKTDPGVCGCGVADVDSDGDGVEDCVDPCPLDNPDDTDSDGVCDSADVCPGFDDGIDSDGDGVPDGCDVCPGFDDNIDSDGDGVPDGCETACEGDVDGDSDVDLDDLTLLLGEFGATGPNLPGDIDGDGDVDLDDLTLLLSNFGATCS